MRHIGLRAEFQLSPGRFRILLTAMGQQISTVVFVCVSTRMLGVPMC